MSKLDVKKLIGAFIIVLAICILMLCITDVFNKIDYINEYNQCIDVSYKTHPINNVLLNECKESVSNGLGITIRTNQLELSTTQYIYIYLMLIIKVLLSVVFLIVGKLFYLSDSKPKTLNNIKTPIVKKQNKKKQKVTRKK
jgi:hypothetical protein